MDIDRPGSPFAPSREALPAEPLDFSLVLGGPLYQLLRRTHLTDDALTLALDAAALSDLSGLSPDEIVERRADKYLAIGRSL